MGKHVDLFEDHLVDADIPVVAALAEDGDRPVRHLRAVLARDDLGHEETPAAGRCVEQRLGDAVAQGGVQEAAGLRVDEGVHFRGQGAELRYVPTDEQGGDAVAEHGQVVRGEEQRVPSPRSGVLDRGTVPVRDLAVLEDEQDGYGFPGLADGRETLCRRLPRIRRPVRRSAGADGSLVVEEESRAAGGE